MGYRVGFIYLWVADPMLCVLRIAIRVASGGHYIPDETVRRRYDKGLRLLPEFLAEADMAYIFSANELPRLIAERADGNMTVHRAGDWGRIISQV
jgi:predicted ABC-type ATPase